MSEAKCCICDNRPESFAYCTMTHGGRKYLCHDCYPKEKPIDVARMKREVERLQAKADQMDEILESCWRYFDHCLRVSLPRESCDTGEVMVRMTLMKDAMRAVGLIGPLPGEGGVQ